MIERRSELNNISLVHKIIILIPEWHLDEMSSLAKFYLTTVTLILETKWGHRTAHIKWLVLTKKFPVLCQYPLLYVITQGNR